MSVKLRGKLVGTVLACAMSLYATGAPVLLVDDGHECCRHEHGPDCHCPSCKHARDLASGRPIVTTCAPHSSIAIPLARASFTLDSMSPPPPPPASPSIAPALKPPPPDPVPEVPTPPPLARA